MPGLRLAGTVLGGAVNSFLETLAEDFPALASRLLHWS